MVRLGIDYGTTNTVVVLSDRGCYPVVLHTTESAIGPISREIFPSIVVRERETGRMFFGPEAERCLARPDAEARYDLIRSLKRLIRDFAEGKLLGEDLVPGGLYPAAVLREFLTALKASILRSGSIPEGEALEAVITWPANANGAQRYLTRQCFREAGFEVTGSLTEPAAAAVEFADRIARGNRMETRKLAMNVGVFDLGGGTFDVSLVRVEGRDFTVIDAGGIEQLGGDDLDEILAHQFARKLKIDFLGLDPFKKNLLLAHARQQKESISSGAVRSLTLAAEDLGLGRGLCTVQVDAFYKEAARLLGPAVEKLWDLIHGKAASEAGQGLRSLDAIYLAGGSSRLPLVPDMVARRFPRVRLITSDKPFSSTAMGAAIHSSETVQLHEILARNFGVMRLADHGAREVFAPIFSAGTRLPPRNGPALEKCVTYTPRHNIGHFRYLECAAVDQHQLPSEGVRYWSETFFPYDPSLPLEATFSPGRIKPREDLHDLWVDETYTCDSDGVISVRMTRRWDGCSRAFEIFRR